jgi:hypothetical protein
VHRVKTLQIRGTAVQRDLALAILGSAGKGDWDQAGIFGVLRRPDHEVRHTARTGVDDHVNQLPRCTVCATDRCSELELHLLAAYAVDSLHFQRHHPRPHRPDRMR